MIATQTPRTRTLTPLVDGVRSVVEAHAGWSDTARHVAEVLRRRLPGSDVLTAEQRVGSPDDYQGHTLHAELDGSFSIVALVWRPGQPSIASTTRARRPRSRSTSTAPT